MKKIILIMIMLSALADQHLTLAQKQGQEKIDSLFNELKTAKADTGKVNTLNAIAYEFSRNDPDTAIYFAHQAEELATKLNFKIGIADAYLRIGIANNALGKLDEALKRINDALKIYGQLLTSEKIGEKSKMLKRKKASALFYIGNIYTTWGNYSEALKNLFAALKIDEEIGDKLGTSSVYGYIGRTYGEQGNYFEALKNIFAALKIYEIIGDKRGIASSYGNIGIIYKIQGNYPQSLKNHFSALKISEEIGDKKGIAASYNNIGNTYSLQGNKPEALKNHFSALKIAEEIGDKRHITISYTNIGNIYTEQKKNSQASLYLNKGLSLAKEIGSLNYMKVSYVSLAALDSAQGNFKQAFERYKIYITYRDSLSNEENTKKLVQTQMQYEFDKKESLAKAEQDKKNVIAKAELQKQKIQKYSFIGGALLFLTLALVLFNRYRLKQRSNNIITKAYDDLKKAQGHLVQSEKMASLGQLTAGVAHEINNPINFVSANVKPLKRNYDELVDFILKKKEFSSEELNYNLAESKQLFSGIEEGAHRTMEIVKGLRNFSRVDEDDLKKANVNEGIESTLMLVHNLLNKRNIEVIKSLGNIPEIKCYPGQLNQVFMNIITNAIDAIGENGKITITTSKENNQVKISIRDTGKGMSEEVKQKIFDPFFTTKDVGKGTGLGLSISYGIIEKHNGKIEVKSEAGKGSEFVITLPV